MKKVKSAEWHGFNKKIRWGAAQISAFNDEETWRGMLEAIGGSRSLSDMSLKGMSRVVDHLAREYGIEFESAKAKRTGDKPYKTKTSQRRSDFYDIPDGPNAKQKRYICAMWKDLGYDMTSIDTRIAREFGIKTFLWCNDQDDLQRIGRDLEVRLKRKREKNAKAGE